MHEPSDSSENEDDARAADPDRPSATAATVDAHGRGARGAAPERGSAGGPARQPAPGPAALAAVPGPSAGQAPGGDFAPRSVGRYRLLALLGRGGMGEVYRARDERLRREVAIKRVRAADEGAGGRRERLEREARLVAQVGHSSVVQVFDLVEEQGELWVVMELVEGQTLAALLDDGPLELARAVRYAAEVAAGLEAAHRRGIVHRDLKVENVMLSRQGQIKVLDFGIAKHVEPAGEEGPALSQEGQVIGTVRAMAPEQARGLRVDARSDLFSLGVLLYELVSGTSPFAAQTALDTLVRVSVHRPASLHELPGLSAVPRALSALVDQLLEKAPELRPESAHHVAQRLAAIADELAALGGAADGRESDAGPASWSPGQRQGASASASAGALLGSTLGAHAVSPAAATGADGARLASAAVAPGISAESVPGGAPPATPKDAPVDAAARMPARVTAAATADATTAATAEAAGDSGADALAASARPPAPLAAAAAGEPGRPARSRGRAAAVALLAVLGAGGVVWRGLRKDSPSQPPRAVALRGAAGPAGASSGGSGDAADDAADDAAAAGDAAALEDPRAAYERAMGLLRQFHRPGAIDEATGIFQRLSARDERSAAAYAGLARAAWYRYTSADEGRDPLDLEHARAAAERAVGLDPLLADAQVSLALVALERGDDRAAEAALQVALGLDGRNADVHEGLARVRQRRQDFDGAEAAYRAALELAPSARYLLDDLGALLLSRGRSQEAIALFLRSIAAAPDSPYGYSNLGAAYLLDGKYAEAASTFQDALKIRPSASLYSNLGTVLFAQGLYGPAANAYERALATGGGSHYHLHWANLGDAYRQLPGSEAKAEQSYRRALELLERELGEAPRSEILRSRRALLRAKSGACVEAGAEATALTRSRALAAYSVYRLAVAQEVCGHRAPAIELVERALALGLPRSEVDADPELRALRADPAYQRRQLSSDPSRASPR